MHTVLLTGGLWYIGSHIAIELLNSHYEYNVIIIDNLSNSSIDKLDIIKNNIEKKKYLHFFEMDLLNYNDLENLFNDYQIHIVIHLAGLKSVGESVFKSTIKTYNLGSGNGISVKQLIDNFEEVNNTKINYEYSKKRDGDLDISYADSSLAEKELGWKTKYNINDMVKLL